MPDLRSNSFSWLLRFWQFAVVEICASGNAILSDGFRQLLAILAICFWAVLIISYYVSFALVGARKAHCA